MNAKNKIALILFYLVMAGLCILGIMTAFYAWQDGLAMVPYQSMTPAQKMPYGAVIGLIVLAILAWSMRKKK